jgi:hypothetical protein
MTVTRPGTAIRGTSPVQMAAAATDNPAGFLLNASTSSGLSPVYTVAPVVVNGVTKDPICSVDDSGIVTWLYDLTLTASQPGYDANGAKCLVTVSQPGDANFAPAADQVIEITATHEANPVLPPGGVVVTKSPGVKMSRKGGTFVGSQDSLTVTISKTAVSLKPGSRGGYIGPIKATITIPYKVMVKGVLTDKTQVCVINYGQLTKMKPTDPKAYAWKTFPNTKSCTANGDALKYFNAGNGFVQATMVIERDRKFSTTLLRIDPGKGGKNPKRIFPTKRLYTFNIG